MIGCLQDLAMNIILCLMAGSTRCELTYLDSQSLMSLMMIPMSGDALASHISG